MRFFPDFISWKKIRMSKRVLTWIKPTSENLHIANYFGSLKHIIDFQNNWYETFLFLANMHGLTTIHNKDDLYNYWRKAIRTYIAVWIDPEKTLIYNPAEVWYHANLSWILGCITTMWYMWRMHSYKDALESWEKEKTTVGTFSYPILMAADILLYSPDIVPVWNDQKQHLEYTRDIAEKFNNTFGETFKLPNPYIPEGVATIPWIDWRKMSKSYNNYIWLFDDDDLILKKVRSITTMSVWIEEPKNPEECNVYNILRLFLTEEENNKIYQRYLEWGLSFKEVKDYLYEKLVEFINPIREKERDLSDEEVKKIMYNWTEKAKQIASEKIKEVYENTGLKI